MKTKHMLWMGAVMLLGLKAYAARAPTRGRGDGEEAKIAYKVGSMIHNAEALLAENQVERAEKLLESVPRLYPKSEARFAAHLALGRHYLDGGEAGKALKQFLAASASEDAAEQAELEIRTEGAPVAGDPGITLDWQGATWRFASPESRALFEADPDRYAPRYGGYCAWAVAEGYTAPTMPEAWKIVDDRLYLNFSRRIQRRWEQDIPGNIARAEANWPGVLGA